MERREGEGVREREEKEPVWSMFGESENPHTCMLSSCTHACTSSQCTLHTLTYPTLSHTHTHSASSRNRCCIRFLLSRVHMRSMHYAVDHLDLDTIFPPSQSVSVKTETSVSIKRCLEELKNSELYSSQQNAITSMLDPACRQVYKYYKGISYVYICVPKLCGSPCD